MAHNKHKTQKHSVLPASDEAKPKLRIGRWLLRNIIAAVVGLGVFTFVVNFNSSYHWLWFSYTKNNIKNFKDDSSLTPDERMVRRLGVDYSYVLTLKALTPENAVIFYPSRADFMATPPVGEKLAFKGSMVDKLAAVRVLYPRKVVLEDELGRTPYAENLTHIAIVNGLHRDMVDYPTDTMAMVDVLPTDARFYVPY